MILVDCRWDYEFNGGSVNGAVNINDGQILKNQLLLGNKPEIPTDIVFYCEFSQVRAVRLSNYFKFMENKLHNRLWYPNIFLLNGGYSRFSKEYPQYTTTGKYIQECDFRYEAQKTKYSDNGEYNMNIPVEDYR